MLLGAELVRVFMFSMICDNIFELRKKERKEGLYLRLKNYSSGYDPQILLATYEALAENFCQHPNNCLEEARSVVAQYVNYITNNTRCHKNKLKFHDPRLNVLKLIEKDMLK